MTSKLNKIQCKRTSNRSCNVRPKIHDFGQITEHNIKEESTNFPSNDFLPNGFTKTNSHSALHEEPKPKYFITAHEKEGVKNFSLCQKSDIVSKLVETATETLYQNKDYTSEAEKTFLYTQEYNSKTVKPRNIRISEVPRLKVIAVKTCKHKCRNIDIRHYLEKIVCMEYDVHHVDSEGNLDKRTQIMRAFFSIKMPNTAERFLKKMADLTKENKFVVTQDIEIIDGNEIGNKCYFDDLRRVLMLNKTKQDSGTKRKTDLELLYEIATLENNKKIPTSTTFEEELPQSELKGLVGLILQPKSSAEEMTKKKELTNELSSTILRALSKGHVMGELLRMHKE